MRRAEVEQVRVLDSHGVFSAPRRIVDTVDLMYRRGQIDNRQRAAAAIYLEAAERIGSGMGSSLDDERVRASGSPGRGSPTDAEMMAARRLAEAARLLGKIDGAIVATVVGQGLEVRETAARLFGRGTGSSTRRMADHVGLRLRLALDMLADQWVDRGSFR